MHTYSVRPQRPAVYRHSQSRLDLVRAAARDGAVAASRGRIVATDHRPRLPYFSTTVLLPFVNTRRSACHLTARLSTTLSKSEPMLTRSSGDIV